MNGTYSAEEVYTDSNIQYIVQYAGAVRIYLRLYEGLLYSYDRATDSEVSVFFWSDHHHSISWEQLHYFARKSTRPATLPSFGPVTLTMLPASALLRGYHTPMSVC
jgi:hypothetical protein